MTTLQVFISIFIVFVVIPIIVCASVVSSNRRKQKRINYLNSFVGKFLKIEESKDPRFRCYIPGYYNILRAEEWFGIETEGVDLILEQPTCRNDSECCDMFNIRKLKEKDKFGINVFKIVEKEGD